MCELGHAMEPAAESKVAERLPITSSTTLSDRETFEKLGFGQPTDPAKPDQFAAMFNDATIDIQTGALLGRYISEERDSTRMFQACYQQLCAEENGASSANATEERLSRVECLLEELVARLSTSKAK